MDALQYGARPLGLCPRGPETPKGQVMLKQNWFVQYVISSHQKSKVFIIFYFEILPIPVFIMFLICVCAHMIAETKLIRTYIFS